jgi:MFS family permease
MATAREKRLTLAAAVLGTSVVFLDATVTSVALPAIRGDLGGGLAGQQWVTNAYLLALVSLLLLIGGSLGDVFGQKRVFLAGVAGFGLTSALCAIASSIPELCVFRSMQGVCAALVTPTALAVIIHVFPEDERARAIGTWAALSSIVGVIGPFIGGVLIAAGSWRLIFLLNAPLVLVTVNLIARGVPGGARAGTSVPPGFRRGTLGGGRALGFSLRRDRRAGARMEHAGRRLARGRDSGSDGVLLRTRREPRRRCSP